MTAFKWLFTWFSGRLATTQNEDSKMPDDLIQSGVAVAANVLPLGADASLAQPLAPASPVAISIEAKWSGDVIEKLEVILSALGHELPTFWEEAVVLARKAV